jgi:hypothetical protein
VPAAYAADEESNTAHDAPTASFLKILLFILDVPFAKSRIRALRLREAPAGHSFMTAFTLESNPTANSFQVLGGGF